MRVAFTIFLVILTRSVYSRSIKGGNATIDLISDGPVDRIIELPSNGSLRSTTVTCTAIYGFLPCTTVVWGQLFLVVVYEFLLAVAGQYTASGSNLFFQMFGTGVFGASLFQLMGVIPQLVIMLVSILSSSTDTVETMATMQMAMLAGSAIFSLTIVWGSIIAVGAQDPTKDTSSNSTSSTQQRNKFFSLLGSSVETDSDTKHVAKVMFVSMIPFLTLQLAKIITSSTGQRVVILISLIISAVFFSIYCIYEVFQPWIQKKRFDYIMSKYAKDDAIRKMVTVKGKPDQSRMKELFKSIDKNGNASLSEEELFAFIVGIRMDEAGIGSCRNTALKLLEAFEITPDQKVTEEEFVKGLSKWLQQGTSTTNTSGVSNSTRGSTEEHQSLLSQDGTTTTTTTTTATQTKPSGPAWWNYTKAGFLILFGTGVMMALGQPLMESLEDFATSASIPSFIVTYVLMPLAMGYRQAVGAISSAKKKNKTDISLALTEVYTGVFSSNVMGLTIFLLLVYIKDISWDVSAEVLLVLIICSAMGFLTSCLTKFPFWISIVSYTLYPISLALLYVLTSVLGWD